MNARLTDEEYADPYTALEKNKENLARAKAHIERLTELLEDQDRAMSESVKGLIGAYEIECAVSDFGDKHIVFRPTMGSFIISREAIFEMKEAHNIARFLEDESRIWARKVLQRVWDAANPKMKGAVK